MKNIIAAAAIAGLALASAVASAQAGVLDAWCAAHPASPICVPTPPPPPPSPYCQAHPNAC